MPADTLTKAVPIAVALRPPDQVMRLGRMGAMFQTRLSFMRSLIRRMAAERWTFERRCFDIDDTGFGVAIYVVHTPERTYSLIAFAHDLPPEQRTDRVIAEAWDATFNLFDGVPTDADIDRLRLVTPKQEAGRFSDKELVLARANKSLRLFDHVVARLADGRQPDIGMLVDVGYLMRTTAVYGNGKFGCADRSKIADRPEMRTAFQAEMLTVYLVRLFTVDLVEHIARGQGGAGAVGLSPPIRCFLGIGNATGLGMAPFLVSHPVLTHNWVLARETALARARGIDPVPLSSVSALRRLTDLAAVYVDEWVVEDALQTERIAELCRDIGRLRDHISIDACFNRPAAIDALYRWGENDLSVEGQELLVSILLEPFGDQIDDLCHAMQADVTDSWDPVMSIATLRSNLQAAFAWALAIDFASPQSTKRFWYYSDEKLEPRFGDRTTEPGAEHEMPIAVARDVARLDAALADVDPAATVAEFVMRNPEHRFAIRRVQTAARYPYAEIRDNLIDANCRPIDMLRFKLALFGAGKYDPKSSLWTRITLFQGAPFPEDLSSADADDWLFPIRPEAEA